MGRFSNFFQHQYTIKKIIAHSTYELFLLHFCRWKKIVNHWPTISQPIAILFIIFLIWGLAYTILPEYTKPNSVIIRMSFLFVGAQICGLIVTVLRLPDMLGMLFWGVLYTNIGLGDFQGYEGLEAVLR